MLNKKVIMMITLSVIIMLTATIFLNNHSESEMRNPYFLKCLGDYAVITSIDDDIEISLFYIDSSSNPALPLMLKNATIAFADKSVSVLAYDIVKGDQHEDIALYSLNIKLNMEKETCLLKDLIIIDSGDKAKQFDLGKIAIRSKMQLPTDVEMNSTGASNRLNRYSVSLKNIVSSTIKITDIETGLFSNIIDSIDYHIINNTSNPVRYLGEDIELLKDSTLDMTFTFNEDTQYDYFIFNPIIIYEVNNHQQKISPYYATYGYAYNDEKIEQFKNIYKKEYKN